MKTQISRWTIFVVFIASGLVTEMAVTSPVAHAATNVVTTFTSTETETAVGGSILLTASIDTSTGASGGTISFYNSAMNDLFVCTTNVLVNGVGSCLFEPVNAGGAWNIHYSFSALWSNNQNQKTGGVLTYATTKTASINFFVAGIPYFSYSTGSVDSLKYESTTAVHLAAQTNIRGRIVFKLNNETITATDACQGIGVSSTKDAYGYADCYFTPPASPAVQRLTVDLYPDIATYGQKYPVLLSQNPTTRTLDSYYFPNGSSTPTGIAGENIDNGYKWYVDSGSTTRIKNRGFLNIDGLFYKLNRATQEAVVMAYDRFTETKTSTISIPAYITPTLNQLSQTGKTGYAQFANLTYTVKYIMSGAFSFPTAVADRTATGTSYSGVTGVIPETVTSILLPNTLSVIGNQAFSNNCFIREMRIPDSVTHIGTASFGGMRRNTIGCDSPGVTGLETLTVGAGVTNIGTTAFLNLDNIKSLTFRGSKPVSLRNDKYPGKLNDYDQWQAAHTYTSYENWAPTADLDSGVCSLVFYRYSGTVGITSGAASTWAPWFDGCLAGILREEIFTPTIPRSVVASNASLTSLRVKFLVPESDGGSGINDYKIEYTSNNGGSWLTASSTSTSLEYNISGLSPSTSYRFRVSARNVAGYSDPSSISRAFSTLTPIKPNPPTIGRATLVDSRTASVVFSAPSDDGGSPITSYTVTSYPQRRTASGSSSPIQIAGLTFGSAETFTVTATNAFGTSDSSTASNILIPNDVFNVTFDSQGGSSISSGSFVSGESVTAPSSNPTRNGHSFNGWFFSSSGGSALAFPYLPGVTRNITLYAQWAIINSAPAPAVLGPPPSTFVIISKPKISRSGTTLVCTSGSYKFKKQGGLEEASNISAQLISLLSNGAVVDSEKTLESKSSFESNASYKGATLSCAVEIRQDEVIKSYSSIDTDAISEFEAAMSAAIYGANTSYYSERDAAYIKRDAGDTRLWKEMLDKAQVKREGTKVQAGVDYLSNLENAGISLVIAAEKAVPTPAPIPTSTKSPEVSVTGNVQPVEMKLVGRIHFASGTYFLNDEAKKTIKALASSIFMKAPTTVLSYGFTDSKGGTDNTVLSQNRSKTVAKLLRSLLPGQKIATGWYASSKPVATGNSKAALAKNRRVEIYIK